jgi:tripartite-type tricarboxylate transporter receptor subunit TctC
MPQDIADKINADVRAILKTPEIREFYKRESIVTIDMDYAAFNTFFRDEVKKWHGVIADVGVKVE